MPEETLFDADLEPAPPVTPPADPAGPAGPSEQPGHPAVKAGPERVESLEPAARGDQPETAERPAAVGAEKERWSPASPSPRHHPVRVQACRLPPAQAAGAAPVPAGAVAQADSEADSLEPADARSPARPSAPRDRADDSGSEFRPAGGAEALLALWDAVWRTFHPPPPPPPPPPPRSVRARAAGAAQEGDSEKPPRGILVIM